VCANSHGTGSKALFAGESEDDEQDDSWWNYFLNTKVTVRSYDDSQDDT
jgi:hypothetical protein